MEAEAKILQAIFDQGALGIAQISVDGSWLRVNDRYCQMLGYSQARLAHKEDLGCYASGDYDEEFHLERRRFWMGAISLPFNGQALYPEGRHCLLGAVKSIAGGTTTMCRNTSLPW